MEKEFTVGRCVREWLRTRWLIVGCASSWCGNSVLKQHVPVFFALRLRGLKLCDLKLRALNFCALKLRALNFCALKLRELNFCALKLRELNFCALKLRESIFCASELPALKFCASELCELKRSSLKWCSSKWCSLKWCSSELGLVKRSLVKQGLVKQHKSINFGFSVIKAHQKKPIQFLIGLALAGTLASCTDSIVPTNAVLDITPSSHTVQITEFVDDSERCLYLPDNVMDIPLVLQLSTVNGSPIGDTSIAVYTDFSGNTYPGYPVLSLYDDLNSNGVVDVDTELVSGFDDDIAVVKSGKFNGAKTLLLRVNLSCSFRGEVRAIAGGISGTAVIEVSGVGVQSALESESEARPESEFKLGVSTGNAYRFSGDSNFTVFTGKSR